MDKMEELARTLEVDAEPRYWEDATVNGATDDDGTLIPGRVGDAWRVRIDLASGRIADWPEGTTADIHYKVCDQGLYWLLDAAGERIAEYGSSYVPSAMCHGGQGFGDYIIMRVGPDGQIADYTVPKIVALEWQRLSPKDNPNAE